MNKVIIALLAVVTLASCTQPKFGVVNTEKIITEYQETVDAEAKIKVTEENSKKEIDALVQAFQVKVGEYQKNASKMSSKKRAQTEQALGAEQQMIQQKQQQVQYQIQNEGQKVIKEIATNVNDFVKDYGKKNGYQIIFGTVNLNGAVMYSEDKVDLTETILTALNNSYKKGDASTKEETKSEEVKKDAVKKEKTSTKDEVKK